MTINSTVITQHAENASFHWLLRDQAVQEPHYSLKDLAKLDGRLVANLDGLRIAGEAGWNILNEHYAWNQPGEIFVASLLAFESGEKQKINKLEELASQSIELSRGMVSALGWLNLEQARPHIEGLLDSGKAVNRRIGCAASAAHRSRPAYLGQFLQDEDAMVRARALRLAGELGDRDYISLIMQVIHDTNNACRYWAAYAATLLGYADGLSALRQSAEQVGENAAQAVDLACRVMPGAEAVAWQKALAAKPEALRLALKAAASIGDAGLMPWIIGLMQSPETARAAGEAFSMITSVDIAYEDLEGEWPEGFEAGPTENPEDEDVKLDPDEDLPWPNPKLIEIWWHKNKQIFKSGVKYLCGKPISDEQCQHVLKYGYQRQRAAAAIELAMMHPGTPLFNVKAPGFRQQQLLGLK